MAALTAEGSDGSVDGLDEDTFTVQLEGEVISSLSLLACPCN